jgi:hypothetical protein
MAKGLGKKRRERAAKAEEARQAEEEARNAEEAIQAEKARKIAIRAQLKKEWQEKLQVDGSILKKQPVKLGGLETNRYYVAFRGMPFVITGTTLNFIRLNHNKYACNKCRNCFDIKAEVDYYGYCFKECEEIIKLYSEFKKELGDKLVLE